VVAEAEDPAAGGMIPRCRSMFNLNHFITMNTKTDWTEVKDGNIEVPDHLMPLFNKIGIQMRLHTISGKNEMLTICHILRHAELFFDEQRSNEILAAHGQNEKLVAENLKLVREDRRKTFLDLSIHEKITCKHNACGFHGRWTANSWAYQYERIDLRYYLTFNGNQKGLRHQWLNRKNKSWETLRWMKSKKEIQK
jgi:hypothetical protein